MSKLKNWKLGVAATVLVAGTVTGVTVARGTGNGTGNPSVLVPIVPCRLADNRADQTVGTRNTPLAAAETVTFNVWNMNGNCQIPTTATGISANVTIDNPTGNSYLTVYPADAPTRPLSSNLNWTATSAPTPNQVTVGLSNTGQINVYNNAGTVNVIIDIIDIVGYYQPAGAGGQQGPQGPQGPTGPAAWDLIRSGTTVTGSMRWDSDTPVLGHDFIIPVSLPGRSPVLLTDTRVNFAQTAVVTDGDASCTGTVSAPTAPPGKVCLYLQDSFNASPISGAAELLQDRGFDVKLQHWAQPVTCAVTSRGPLQLLEERLVVEVRG